MNKIVGYLILLSFLAGACSRSGNGDVSEFDTVIYQPRHADRFRILGSDGRKSTVIEVRNPWQGADSVVTRLLVLRDGEREPDGFEGKILRGDAQRVVALSSSYVAMLDAIGEVDRVTGVSGLDFLSNKNILSRRDSLHDVGYDGNFNYEALIAADPDLVLIYGVNGSASIEKQLDRLGMPYLYVGEYLEQSPVAKAEWLIAVAESVGRRDVADTVFKHIEERYDSIKRKIATSPISRRPAVMLNTPYGDSWFMPSSDNYMVRLIKDAGGEYVYSENTSGTSLPIDFETAMRLLDKADYWINLGVISGFDDLKRLCPKHLDCKVVAERRLFNNDRLANRGGGNDFWESGVVYPVLILEDLAKILHPEIFEPGDTVLTYYRHIN